MTDLDGSRDEPVTQGRAARVVARRRGFATARRVTVGLALTAAAAISGITGALAATATDTATATTTDGKSTSTLHSGNRSGTDDWGSANSPGSAGGQPGHTSTSGS